MGLKGIKKYLPKLAKLLLFVWFGTIFLFFYGIWFVNSSGEKYFIHQNFFIADVFLGIIAFLLTITFAILGTDSKTKKQKGKQKNKPKKTTPKRQTRLSYYIAGTVAVLLLAVAFLNTKYENLSQESKVKNYDYLKKNFPTPLPTSTTEPRVRGSTTNATPTVDPDPIVNCQFKYLGSKQIRSSECSKSFECQIGGQWYIYTSRERCKRDQENYWNTRYGSWNYTYPTLEPYPTFNYYYYEPTPEPTLSPKEIQHLLEQQEQAIEQCKREVHSYYNLQVRNCYIRFGGSSSAGPACEEIMNNEREKELKKCEQI